MSDLGLYWLIISICCFLSIWLYGLLMLNQRKNCVHSWQYLRKCVNCGRKEKSKEVINEDKI